MDTLKNYTDTLLRLNLFKKLNAKTLSGLGELESNLLDAKALLQNKVKETKTDIENKVVKVSYIERYKKYYDYKSFLKIENEKEYLELEKAKGIITEIDKKVFDDCVKKGNISRETRLAIFKEELLSTSVLIKNKL